MIEQPGERQVTPRWKQPSTGSTQSWGQRSRDKAKAKAGRAPGSTLAATGARAKRLAPALAAAYREVDIRDSRTCQYGLIDPTHRCRRNAQLHHDHLWPRNVRPDLRQKPWAIVLLCADAHNHVTNNPDQHRSLRVAVLAQRIAEWIDPCPA